MEDGSGEEGSCTEPPDEDLRDERSEKDLRDPAEAQSVGHEVSSEEDGDGRGSASGDRCRPAGPVMAGAELVALKVKEKVLAAVHLCRSQGDHHAAMKLVCEAYDTRLRTASLHRE